MNAANLIRTTLFGLLLVIAGCSTTTHHEPPDRQASAHRQTAPATAEAGKPASADLRATPPAQAKAQVATGPVLPAPTTPAERLTGTLHDRHAMAPAAMAAPGYPGRLAHRAPPRDRETYAHFKDNPIHRTEEEPVSTFGIDVDTGSYTNVRRILNEGRLPPADAVRAEEFLNYFDYAYAPPANREQPFSVTTELAPAPWNRAHQLLLVGIQGYRVPRASLPPANLVLLIDTSGSMNSPDKLPLLQASLRELVTRLRPQDRVAIVTYAGRAGLALASTAGDQQATILAAINSLQPAGSTNGQAGIRAAYAQARQNFIDGGVNRVILATDGDFNVGVVSREALQDMVERQRRDGVALSVFGFGRGNYNDAMAMRLADAGNGSYHYIDSLLEARKVFAQELGATLLTIAKDVKIQIEFNPAQVAEYRLIGYGKRLLDRADFNNDAVDAGDIGAGANVTALYELIPAGSTPTAIDPLRYAAHQASTPSQDHELAYLRLRYKQPGHSRSRLIEAPILASGAEARASQRLRFAAAVAAFAQYLRGGKYLDGFDLAQIATLARGARGDDRHGWRGNFVQLVELAASLQPARHAPLAKADPASAPPALR